LYEIKEETSEMRIILLGAPGAGKGTQAELVCESLGIPIISTGNIIRAALKNGTEIGLKAKEFIEKGQLVPDEVVIEIVKERIEEKDCENGFILDGFPRTVTQAEALDKMGIKIDKVLDLEVSDELIYLRMSGRRMCEECGSTYNINTDKKSRVEGKCDRCSGNLIQRTDDTVETVAERLKVYQNQTKPLTDYYKKQGKLIRIDGERPMKTVTEEMLKEIRG
jgi:adenylate kinase